MRGPDFIQTIFTVNYGRQKSLINLLLYRFQILLSVPRYAANDPAPPADRGNKSLKKLRSASDSKNITPTGRKRRAAFRVAKGACLPALPAPAMPEMQWRQSAQVRRYDNWALNKRSCGRRIEQEMCFYIFSVTFAQYSFLDSPDDFGRGAAICGSHSLASVRFYRRIAG